MFTLLVGQHNIEVRTGQGSWTGTAEVKERQVAQVSAQIKAAPIAAPATSGGRTGSGGTEGMVHIPGGTFTMGCSPGDSECNNNEKPAKQVTVDSFYMDVYEVTQAQYERVMGTNPSSFKGCADCPVETVTWNGANNYCSKIGKRLPTEAQWEYAARGGTTGSRYGSVAWYSSNSGNKTHPVGQKQPNAFGLYDMLGNVWEWCQDWYDEKWYSRMPERNPVNSQNNSYRVLRGGCWDDDPWRVRASFRGGVVPGGRGNISGFRCSRD
jgi:formylglycine-generating enzyme required for sulfatase activity